MSGPGRGCDSSRSMSERGAAGSSAGRLCHGTDEENSGRHREIGCYEVIRRSRRVPKSEKQCPLDQEIVFHQRQAQCESTSSWNPANRTHGFAHRRRRKGLESWRVKTAEAFRV